ncbi:cupin domain-containing protein [Massilia sp. IC2-477]|uniref:cupin domain-containing protein n=1 Tax=Massilia sp. IC2-477 TaxID=2887198 RepID=UPI001D11A1BB|nr:cupin domain-containing protein [Massilia sp. IC2-477]MCC2955170.1 cupin domain-containing protein [Massilia sp. IC2-477]
MLVRHLNTIPAIELPGLKHQTLASREGRIGSFEVWQQSLAPGAVTPLHRHDCEEAIIFTGGNGIMRHDGVDTPCHAGTVLLCQPNELHQIVNNGSEDLRLYGILAVSPVPVVDEHGEAIPLPW